MRGKSMNHRTMAILRAIIEEYVSNAEPVGSKTVASKYNFGVSSATIRNEMALLEDMGFIASPHTSAGRVPMEKAYRFYVDTIIDESLSDFGEEFLQMSSYLEPESFRRIVEKVSREVSAYTHYASIAIIAADGRDTIDLVHFIRVGEKEILCVIMMESKKTISFTTETISDIPKEKLDELSLKMTEKLKGVKSFNIAEQDVEAGEYLQDINNIHEQIANQVAAHCDVDVIVEGTSNLFDFPEFHDFNVARDIVRIFNEQQLLCNMFRKPGRNEIEVKIGSENEILAFQGMTTMYRTFDFNTRGMISFGVAGPLRMNYRKVIASMRDVDKLIREMLMMI
jgi:heat-inducible transcriptional repressor